MSEEEANYEDETAEESSKTDGGYQLPRLSFEEARALGCLLEKEATTPDNYPLTLNSLHSASNQSSNREPVTDLGTDEVEDATEGLRLKKLCILLRQSGARVPKYKHTIENVFPYLTKGQTALLCVLFLRGQQTAGELRQRTERMHPFTDVGKVEHALDELIDFKPCPIVKKIPAGGGRRVVTYVHLLCGDVEISDLSHTVAAVPASIPAAPGWREEMEEEITSLKEQVGNLREEISKIQSELGL